MSRIYVEQVVGSGVGPVSFPEGLKVFGGKTLDLNGAAINLSTGLGVAGQLLSTTGSSLQWVTRTDTDTTYTLGAQNVSLNDVRLNLTAGGTGSGTQFVSVTGSGATTLSYNSSTNVITVGTIDNNTTYSVSSVDGTAGKKIIRLTSSNPSTTDDVTLVAGTNVSLGRVGDEITINSSYVDTNTTYSLDGSLVTTNLVNLELIAGGSGSGTDTFSFAGSGLTTVSWDEGNQRLIVTTPATDTNTTYSVSATDGTTGKKIIRLTSANPSTTDDVTLVAGTNVSLGRVGDEITINSSYVDTNTTYDLGATTVSGKPVIRFTSSSGTTKDITFISGPNIGVTRSGDTITISGSTYGVSTSSSVYSNALNLSLNNNGVQSSSVAVRGSNGILVSQDPVTNGFLIGAQSRTTISATTSSLTQNGQQSIDILGYRCYVLMSIRTSATAWVRIYTDNDSRIQDQNRVYGSGALTAGIIADVTTSGTQIFLTPNKIGFDSSPSETTPFIYISIVNRSGTTQPIAVNLNLMQLQ